MASIATVGPILSSFLICAFAVEGVSFFLISRLCCCQRPHASLNSSVSRLGGRQTSDNAALPRSLVNWFLLINSCSGGGAVHPGTVVFFTPGLPFISLPPCRFFHPRAVFYFPRVQGGMDGIQIG